MPDPVNTAPVIACLVRKDRFLTSLVLGRYTRRIMAGSSGETEDTYEYVVVLQRKVLFRDNVLINYCLFFQRMQCNTKDGPKPRRVFSGLGHE